jgi:hypothetical protein
MPVKDHAITIYSRTLQVFMKFMNSGKVFGLLVMLIASVAVAAETLHQPPPGYPVVTPEQHAAALAEQQKAIDEMHAHEALLKNPTCSDPIPVTIAGYKLLMPRYGEYVLSNGDSLTYIDHHCDIKRLDNIRSVSFLGVSIADRRTTPKDFKYQYEWDKAFIEDGRAQGHSTRLPDGMERITKGYWYEYILPQKTNPTADGKPVAVNCGGNPGNITGDFSPPEFCTTSYLYKNNLIIGYRVFSAEFVAKGYVLTDQDKRTLVEKFMDNGVKK